MKRALETFFHYGPIVFAVGFLWPLLADLLIRAGIDSAWAIAGVVALGLGVLAQTRGRWV